jgi:folate-dependent phosphoribosylglycinamide formyltransferase PurN
MKKLLVFATGTPTSGGSGFEKLVHYACMGAGTLDAELVDVVSNHANGGVRQKADRLRIPFFHMTTPFNATAYQEIATSSKADFFALSGWLKLVNGLDPKTKFNSQTVFNIHPGPLPKFGGPGMHGHHVHEEVMKAYHRGDITHSEVCMHFVTPKYDDGPVFFRFPVEIQSGDTADSLAARVNKTEHTYQALITHLLIQGAITWDGINSSSLVVRSGYPF